MDVTADLGQVDLNLLHTFRTVADCGGVSLAARRLHRSQPAVSGRLRQLEGQLGVELFERVGRRVVLTTAGLAIVDEVRRICDGLQGVLDRLRAVTDEPAGLLRLGALPTVSVHLLAPVVARFVATYPRAQVELSYGLTRDQLEALRKGSLDMVASVGPPPRELDVYELAQAVPVAAVPARSPLARRPALGVADLRAYPIVGFGRIGDLFYDAVWSFLEAHGLVGNVRIQAPHIQNIQQLVLAGAGIGIVPGYTVQTRGVVARPVAGLKATLPIWLAVRRSGRGIPLIAGFLAAARGAR